MLAACRLRRQSARRIGKLVRHNQPGRDMAVAAPVTHATSRNLNPAGGARTANHQSAFGVAVLRCAEGLAGGDPLATHRTEPSINPGLGNAIGGCHPRSQVGTQQTGLLDSAKQPDIVIDVPGRVRALVENKYDTSTGEGALEKQCDGHAGAAWASGAPVEAIIGVLSPLGLRTCPEADVESLIRSGQYRYAAWLPGRSPARFPETGWIAGGLQDLAAFVDRVTADALDSSTIAEDVRRALAAAADHIAEDPLAPVEFPRLLNQEASEQTMRMAAAIMFNAAVFQAHISEHHANIPSPARMLSADDCDQFTVLSVWKDILDFDYWPIFGIGRRLLFAMNHQVAAGKMLRLLFRLAAKVVENPNAQGLVGRLFGELIGDRKFLAAFYTRPASAALVAELAVSRLGVNWGNPEAAASVQVGDLACGTGALLTAVYRRIAERHRTGGGDDALIHRRMLEDSFVGCDILSAAVHLTAARLSGEQPAVDYARTRTWVMPYGDTPEPDGTLRTRLGSIDLLDDDTQAALWGDGTIGVTPEGDTATVTADVPEESLDVMIMNPPFTRSVGHEGNRVGVPQPAFAGLGNSSEEQAKMAKLLKKASNKVGHRPTAYSGQVGLGSIFADLAHVKLKPGGVLALILPASAIAGKEWANLRALLATAYEQIQVLSIAETGSRTSSGSTAADAPDQAPSGYGNRAFSADTGMAEVVLVATKKMPNGDAVMEHQVALAEHVILDKLPGSAAAAVEFAKAIRGRGGGSTTLTVGSAVFGRTQLQSIGPGVRGHPTGVIGAEVADFAAGIEAGQLRLPRLDAIDVSTAPLSSLADRGAYHMDINGLQPDGTYRGPFDINMLQQRRHHSRAGYPVLWQHDHTMEQSLEVLPDSAGTVRDGMTPKALDRWNGWTAANGIEICGATRLHINRDFQVNSQALGACLTPQPAIGGRAWPSAAPSPALTSNPEEWEKALVLWLNTTPGLVARWWISNRQQKGRANLSITTIGDIPVLNLRALPGATVTALAAQFDAHKNTVLLPANEAYRDEARRSLDDIVLCQVLGISGNIHVPLSTIREAWCAEPSVHGGKSTQP